MDHALIFSTDLLWIRCGSVDGMVGHTRTPLTGKESSRVVEIARIPSYDHSPPLPQRIFVCINLCSPYE
jgi:hypothetical protein